jgi:hypothetical protein
MSLSKWLEMLGRDSARKLIDGKAKRGRRARGTVAARQALSFGVESLEHRWFLSSAIAAFGVQKTFSAGTAARTVTTADVNGDGKADLIFADPTNPGAVSVLLGNGDGTFKAAATFATVGDTAIDVAASDITGDGKIDLVVATLNSHTGGSNLSVLLGNGNGTFSAARTVSTGTGIAFSVAVSDVDKDGKPDVIFASGGASIGVLLGNGNGTFKSLTTFATANGSTAIAVGDLNGDGSPDVVVGAYST